MTAMSRRQWAGVSLSVFAIPQLIQAGIRVLSRTPLITAQDFARYPEVLTPTEDFYVRNHFAIPEVDTPRWQVRCEGLVTSPRTVRLMDLREMNQVEITSVLECAGNGTGMGGVGCARWAGVRLADVLASCKVDPRARWVRMTGLDRGSEPDSTGEIFYSRTIPLERAMSPWTLLALMMNGAPLTTEHGAPCRALVGGHYGMDSVKWLQRVELLDRPDDSPFMARRFRRVISGSVLDSVSTMLVKSLLVKPAVRSVLRGTIIEAGGYAWAGTGLISNVEVQIDSGAWRAARLLEQPRELVWMPWIVRFEGLKPGVHDITVRASTDAGQGQPAVRDPRRQDAYELNQYQSGHFFIRP